MSGLLRPWRLNVLAAAGVALSLLLAPVSGASPVEAVGVAPDLAIDISTGDLLNIYTPGAAATLTINLRNEGFTAAFPFVNTQVPATFTNVRVRQNGSDTCQVKPPTAAINGHIVACKAITGLVNGEFPGILGRGNPRSIVIDVNVPRQAGNYDVRAGIGNTDGPDGNGQNNNAVTRMGVKFSPAGPASQRGSSRQSCPKVVC